MWIPRYQSGKTNVYGVERCSKGDTIVIVLLVLYYLKYALYIIPDDTYRVEILMRPLNVGQVIRFCPAPDVINVAQHAEHAVCPQLDKILGLRADS
jgi:hypothetical protein